MAAVIRSRVVPCQVIETRIFVTGPQGEGTGTPGGPAAISADPRNTLVQKGDGLFAAPKLSSAQW